MSGDMEIISVVAARLDGCELERNGTRVTSGLRAEVIRRVIRVAERGNRCSLRIALNYRLSTIDYRLGFYY